MVYFTIKQNPYFRQMTLEEYLFEVDYSPVIINENMTNTKTYEVNRISERLRKRVDVDALISSLEKYNMSTEEIRKKDRKSLYDTFYIPKKTGGLRQIDAPQPELMNQLRVLKTILEDDFCALYHTSAFAYIKHRSTVDAVKRHQQNESRWFIKLDLHNFFGSTTPQFVMKMLSMVFPFCEIVKVNKGKEELERALDLAFLNGGLPQGTPISPLLTNIMMIPFDFRLSKALRNFDRQHFVYTRYADDFIISSKYDFDPSKIEKLILDILNEFEAPFSLNTKKTRYGSSNGSNWNLGLMLNKDNEITVGHKRKRQFKSMMNNYMEDRKKGIPWPKEDLMVMQGLHSYYRMVEKDTIDSLVRQVNHKLGADVFALIKADLQ